MFYNFLSSGNASPADPSADAISMQQKYNIIP
jgi:hypothetical protein